MPNEYKSAYARRSVRVSRLVTEHCRYIAGLEGWEAADLLRTLICMGAAFSFLTLKKEEFRERHKERVMLSRMLGQLNPILGGRSRRPYALPRAGASGLITLRLPQGLSEIITRYAQTSGSSPNHMLSRFLEWGLIIYLKGENTLLKTMSSLTQDRVQIERPEKQPGPQAGVQAGDADAEQDSSTSM